MPTGQEVASWASDYFRTAQARAAAVLAGPKRETGFWGGAGLELVYASTRGEFIAISARESLVFDWQGMLVHHQTLGRAPSTLIARPDLRLYQGAIMAGINQPATQLFGADGLPIGAPLLWDTQPAAGRAALIYIPDNSAGALRGRLVAQWGQRLVALHPSGDVCFPAVPRTLADGGADALVVANPRTGGYARFYAGSGQLGMRVYLSNGIAY